MKVIRLDDVEGTDRDVEQSTWRSRRLVLANDGVGFSFHDTVMYAGTTTDMWYAHHVEAVYCYQGKGVLTNRDTGEQFPIRPGTLYLLEGHDKHRVTVEEDLHFACVFTPPLTGREVHDEHGVYPVITEDPTHP